MATNIRDVAIWRSRDGVEILLEVEDDDGVCRKIYLDEADLDGLREDLNKFYNAEVRREWPGLDKELV